MEKNSRQIRKKTKNLAVSYAILFCIKKYAPLLLATPTSISEGYFNLLRVVLQVKTVPYLFWAAKQTVLPTY